MYSFGQIRGFIMAFLHMSRWTLIIFTPPLLFLIHVSSSRFLTIPHVRESTRYVSSWLWFILIILMIPQYQLFSCKFAHYGWIKPHSVCGTHFIFSLVGIKADSITWLL